MNEMVTILVSAGGASERMLRTCLECIEQHKSDIVTHRVMVVVPHYQSSIASSVAQDMHVELSVCHVDSDNLSGSRVHAAVLDKAIKFVNTHYVLTLDADCFPADDKWLDALMAPMGGGAKVTGILHPYAPPPESLPKTGLEYRIRSQLCWNNTHVACQLVSLDTLKRLGVGYSDGDDTGLAIPIKAREMGIEVAGLMPTRCAAPEGSNFMSRLEFNRDTCVLFGDMVYHHGGGSREEQGKGSPEDVWASIREKVLREGPECLLEERIHKYEFDREEEVADRMVSRIMRGMQIYLQTNDRAFEE